MDRESQRLWTDDHRRFSGSYFKIVIQDLKIRVSGRGPVLKSKDIVDLKGSDPATPFRWDGRVGGVVTSHLLPFSPLYLRQYVV